MNIVKVTKGIIALAILSCAALVTGQTSVSPLLQPRQSFLDRNGTPCVQCRLWSYTAGTTTIQYTYTDSTGTTQNPDPIILDSSGSASVWAAAGQSYKYVLTNPAGAVIWTQDHVTGPQQNLGYPPVNKAGDSGLKPLGINTGLFGVATQSAIATTTVPAGILYLQTAGYSAPGDGGGAVYMSASAGAGTCKVQSADGAWWIVSNAVIKPKMCGADNTGATDSAAVFAGIASLGKLIEVDAGDSYLWATALTLASGTSIVNNGTITAHTSQVSLSGSFSLTGSGTVTGNSTLGSGFPLMVAVTGDISIQGQKFRNDSGGSNRWDPLLSLQPSSAGINSVKFIGNDVQQVGYGVGASANTNTNTIQSVNVSHNSFYDLTGDPIELNETTGTLGIVIDGNTIDYVHGGAVAGHGIGIGVAGIGPYAYPLTCSGGVSCPQKYISITNNVLKRLSQGIHCELCQNVTIANNTISDIDPTLSTTLGDYRAIAVYGSYDVAIIGNHDSNAATGCSSGYNNQCGGILATGYNPPSADRYTISGNVLTNDWGLSVYMERSPTTAPVSSGSFYAVSEPEHLTIASNDLAFSRLEVYGVTDLTLRDNTILHDVGKVGLILAYNDPTVFGDDHFYFLRSVIENNNVHDTFGNPDVQISGTEGIGTTWNANAQLTGGGNSFPLDAYNSTPNTPDSNSLPRAPVGHSYWYNSATSPTCSTPLGGYAPSGINLQKGDVYINKQTGVVGIVTVSGSLAPIGGCNGAPSTDGYTVSNAAEGVVEASTTYQDWTDSASTWQHVTGQLITLTSGGTHVAAEVALTYNSGGNYFMQLADPTSGAPLNLGSLGSGTIAPTTVATVQQVAVPPTLPNIVTAKITSVCTTSATAYSTCTNSIVWPSAFSDANYEVSCTGAPASSGLFYVLYVSSKTTTGATVSLQNGDASAAAATTTSEIDCIAEHP